MSASTSASPPKRGRPNFEAETKRIKLRPDVFDRWLVKKDSLGFTHKAHSQFADYLLDMCEEHRQTNKCNNPLNQVSASNVYGLLHTACVCMPLFNIFNLLHVIIYSLGLPDTFHAC